MGLPWGPSGQDSILPLQGAPVWRTEILQATWWGQKKKSHSTRKRQSWNLNSFSSIQCLAVSDSLWPHELQCSRLPSPSPTPRAYSNSRTLSRWGHPTVSSSVVPFSSSLQSSPASGSFPLSQFFASDGQSIRASASTPVLPMNIQDWFP